MRNPPVTESEKLTCIFTTCGGEECRLARCLLGKQPLPKDLSERQPNVLSAAFSGSGRFIGRLKTPQGRKSQSEVMSRTASAAIDADQLSPRASRRSAARTFTEFQSRTASFEQPMSWIPFAIHILAS